METDAKPSEPESAHTSSRKIARMPPIELITRGERRRRWTVEQKQTIAAQRRAPGASATEVARPHGIGTGQLYNGRKAFWRRSRLRRRRCLGALPVLRWRHAGRRHTPPDPCAAATPGGPTDRPDRDHSDDRHDAAG